VGQYQKRGTVGDKDDGKRGTKGKVEPNTKDLTSENGGETIGEDQLALGWQKGSK